MRAIWAFFLLAEIPLAGMAWMLGCRSVRIYMTAIDSDPPPATASGANFSGPGRVVLTVHGEGTSRRLLKLPSLWVALAC